MNNTNLAQRQIERIFSHVQRELHYLDRLEGRMHQKRFPANDPVYERVRRAQAEMQELSIQVDKVLSG